ncbi:helix-turn-helix domain-containing protein, partial [Streptomyces sp. MBT65]|uniref:helix-turn-helix domain-containing protein n=1 Tax=Streptomyces sp. MBT65 TaxID=1488395 RepID=UPI001909D8E2
MTQPPATPLPPPKERRRLREAGSLTQAQVAARMGVSRETVRSWETGRTTPRGRKREAYATLLTSLSKDVQPEEETVPELQQEPQERQAEVVDTPAPAPEPEPEPVLVPVPIEEPPRPPLTPAQAFDALYAFCAPALVRQAYLLTGRRELARESVERAFQVAWQRWPEVAVDRDPAGWVRSVAYEYALSPWHRFRPRYRHPE